MEVGIKETKNNLSRYLKRVQAGEEILITERGKPIARIIKEGSGSPSLHTILGPLIKKGLVKMPSTDLRQLNIEPVVSPGKSASDMVLEDRR